MTVFFFQAEDGIRDLVRSRGLGDVYKRQQLKMVGTNDNNSRSAWITSKQYVIAVAEENVVLLLSLIHI